MRLFSIFFSAILSGSTLYAQDQRLTEINSALTSLGPALLRRHETSGLQVTIFNRFTAIHRSFGFADAEQTIPVALDTRFQASGLVRPMTAFIASQQLGLDAKINITPWMMQGEEINPDNVEKKVSEILSYTAGFPSSREGFYFPGQKMETLESLIRRNIQPLSSETKIEVTPIGFAILQHELENKTKSSFPDLLTKAVLRPYNLRETSLYANEDGVSYAVGLERNPKFFFPSPELEVAISSADRLWTTSRDYAFFLQKLQASALNNRMFGLVYSYHPELGGVTPAFFFHRMKSCAPVPRAIGKPPRPQPSPIYYMAEGRLPGWSSIALINQEGYGIVLLSNSDRIQMQKEILRYVLKVLYPTSCYAQATNVSTSEILDGFYEGDNILPMSRKPFQMLSHLRIHKNPVGELEFAGVFEKDPAIILSPVKENEYYIARGNAIMDGWGVMIERAPDGSVQKLITDRIVFDKVPLWRSFPGFAIGGASIIILTMLGLLAYFSRRK